MRNVLVISSSEWPITALRSALGDDIDELRVVVPAVHQSRLQWLTNADDDAQERADDTASSIADALPSQQTDAAAGDSNPLLAAETRSARTREIRSRPSFGSKAEARTHPTAPSSAASHAHDCGPQAAVHLRSVDGPPDRRARSRA